MQQPPIAWIYYASSGPTQPLQDPQRTIVRTDYSLASSAPDQGRIAVRATSIHPKKKKEVLRRAAADESLPATMIKSSSKTCTNQLGKREHTRIPDRHPHQYEGNSGGERAWGKGRWLRWK